MDTNERGQKKLDIQQRAFSFACRIIRLYNYISRQKGAGQILCNQILRSGTSIGANLQEASAGQSKADFISKCNIALKEARETYYWLSLLKETNIVSDGKIKELIAESNQIVAIITTIVKNSRKKR